MTSEELLRRLQALITATPQADLIATYRGFKSAHSPEDQLVLDAAMDIYTSGLSLEPQSRGIVVALVHGIRTTAEWQERVRSSLLEETGVVVSPIGYGFLDLIRFIGPFRKKPIERVLSELRDLKRLHPDKDLVLIAHSFGTYIVSKILKNAPDIRISRLLLCGSIIPIDFRWDQIPHEFTQQTLINEVGTKDYWPVVARVASWGYGCSGSFGFKTARVWDRFFAYGHSDFFSDDHFKSFWRPFVLKGQIVNSPWDGHRPTPPWLIAFLGGVPMVKVVVLAAFAGLLGGSYYALDYVLHLMLF